MSTTDNTQAPGLSLSSAGHVPLHAPIDNPEYAITVELKTVGRIAQEIFGEVLRLEFEHDPEIEDCDYVNVWVKASTDRKEHYRRGLEWVRRIFDAFGLDSRQVCLAFEFDE